MTHCDHDAFTGDEGPIGELGRRPKRWRCDQCGLYRFDDETVYRVEDGLAFVSRPVDAWQKDLHAFISDLLKASADLMRTQISITTATIEEDYDGPPDVAVEGWRPATKAEIAGKDQRTSVPNDVP